MAGDWLKFELSTPDKPEVLAIGAKLGIPRPHVVGCLVMIWKWFNQQTVDGNAPVTLAALSEMVGVPGFAEEMVIHRWLSTGEKGVKIPEFERHNGESAKKRALTAKRAQRFRNASVTHAALPREVQRIYKSSKEKSTSKPQAASTIPPGCIKCDTCGTIAKSYTGHYCDDCWRKAQDIPARH